MSVAAAPPQASAGLDLVTELYPDRAAGLAEVLRDYDRVDYDYKDRVNDKNVVGDKNGPVRNDPNSSRTPAAQPFNGDPFATSQDPSGLSTRDLGGWTCRPRR